MLGRDNASLIMVVKCFSFIISNKNIQKLKLTNKVNCLHANNLFIYCAVTQSINDIVFKFPDAHKKKKKKGLCYFI